MNLRAADLKDKRLNHRLREVLSQLGGPPHGQHPSGVRRFRRDDGGVSSVRQRKASFEKILAAHREATRERNGSTLVLLVQDTSEVDVTRPHEQVRGVGPLDGQARWGALLHLVHAFTPDGTPLGTVSGQSWVRDEEAPRLGSVTRAQRAATPIEEKESSRWVEGLRAAGAEARNCPATRFVCVADSEADIYELLAAAGPHEPDWIVRACQNRALQRDSEPASERHLREELLTRPVLFSHTIRVRGRAAKISCETRTRRQPRRSREARVAVRALQATFRPPWRADRRLPSVTVQAVLVAASSIRQPMTSQWSGCCSRVCQ